MASPPAGPILSRRWDLLFIIGVVLLVAAGAHLELMLFTGDWSFWADWKDRQWWPTLIPALNIIFASAIQYIAWEKLRLPIGATVVVLLLAVAQWISRAANFSGFAYIPLNFVAPETMLIMGLTLDLVLFWTRSFVLTSLIGGFLWGAMFQLINAPLFAQLWQPVLYNERMLTVADVMAFEYVRTQTPAYLRIVEEGHLRAFLTQISYVVAFFSGMLSMGTYWIGQFIGRFIGTRPIDAFLPQGRGRAGPAKTTNGEGAS